MSNLLLAMLLLLGARITIAHYVDTAFCSGLLNFLAMTAYMSVGLGLFNLIPISPLDGSKVLFAFLPDRAYMTLMRYEKYGMLVLLCSSGSAWEIISSARASTACTSSCQLVVY